MTIASRPTVNSPGAWARARLRVAKIVQPVDEVLSGDRLTAVNLEGTGKNPRIGALRNALQPFVDHPRESDVVVGGGEGEQQGRDPDPEDRVKLPPAPPGSLSAPGSAGAPGLDGHRRLRQSVLSFRHRL